jgi:hypothetical protein
MGHDEFIVGSRLDLVGYLIIVEVRITVGIQKP